MYNKLFVTASPHVKDNDTTAKIMIKVLIALVPTSIAAVFIFGVRAIAVIAVTVAAAVVTEAITCKLLNKPVMIGDFSAAVTGLILALNLPVSIPLWMAALGAVFAIVIVKQLFGGIGQNFANPAATARVFLLVSFAGEMTTWTEPFNDAVSSATSTVADAVSSATPLATLASGESVNLLDMFLGNKAGSLGEVSILAILIGAIYLIATKVITPVIPVSYVGTVFVLSYLFGADGLAQILTGSVMFGAVFMATDYASSPTTKLGKIIFGIGLGFFTVIIRLYGTYPEGVSYSILLMNIVTPLINKFTMKKPFGGIKNAKA